MTNEIESVFKKFHRFPSLRYIINTDATTTTVLLKIGIQVTLHVVEKNSFGGVLLQETGSIEHYHELQRYAHEKNLQLKSTGLFKKKSKLVGDSEELIYKNLGLSFISPELRENRGEIQAAANHTLPRLVELQDIKGDLHCHTNETDGSVSLEEMVEAARTQGYAYVAITDHSQSLKITHGMDEKRLLKQIEQIEQIDRLNETLSDFVILKSMEVDILEDGSLDLADEVLKELDLTVCSIHSKFHLSMNKQTERIVRAMDNRYFNILGHATGRLISHRPPWMALAKDVINTYNLRD
jgi:DNA polymerase (family 10)